MSIINQSKQRWIQGEEYWNDPKKQEYAWGNVSIFKPSCSTKKFMFMASWGWGWKTEIRGLEIHEIVLDQVIDLRITEAKTVQGQGMKQELVGA